MQYIGLVREERNDWEEVNEMRQAVTGWADYHFKLSTPDKLLHGENELNCLVCHFSFAGLKEMRKRSSVLIIGGGPEGDELEKLSWKLKELLKGFIQSRNRK